MAAIHSLALSPTAAGDRASRRTCAAPAEPAGRVMLFEAEPDLLSGVDDASARLLRRRVAARTLSLCEGPWEPRRDERVGRSLGLLVLGGLVVRTVELRGRRCPELVGAGDLLRPWDELHGMIDHTTSWRVVEGATVAILDARLGAILGRWPSILAQLLARGVARSRSLRFSLRSTTSATPSCACTCCCGTSRTAGAR